MLEFLSDLSASTRVQDIQSELFSASTRVQDIQSVLFSASTRVQDIQSVFIASYEIILHTLFYTSRN